MAKEKVTHIFNKNHIEILKIENPQRPCGDVPCAQYYYSELQHKDMWKTWKPQKPTVIETKKESPLGFYYIHKTYVFNNNKRKPATGQRGVYILTLKGDEKTDYQLKFYEQYDDNTIREGEDGPRPWDICDGDGDFPDNMVDALVEDCEKLFEIMEENGVKSIRSPRFSYYHSNEDSYTPINEFKRKLYTKLFGNPKGPRFQTNEEKIFAHGFDLKYSFRKDKEKK